MANDTVADYMVKEVKWLPPEMKVKDAIEKLIESNFHGFPIAENGYLLGFVTAKDLLKYKGDLNITVRQIMKHGTVCVVPSMKINDATRVLFRYGLRNLPVVDKNKKLVGIISNIDIVRSQIEKSRPTKVMSVKSFLEKQNGLRITVVNMDIEMKYLFPSQKNVYMDELIGRQYEIKRGLNEPLIVVERRGGYLIVDGHHRAMAAYQLGLEKFKAIVLRPNNLDVKLGLEITAEKWSLKTLDDVNIIEGSKHPFIKVTTMLLPNEEARGIKRRLNQSK